MSSFQFTLILAFSAMIFWGFGDFLTQKVIKKIGDFQTLLWTNLIAGLILMPFVLNDLPSIFTKTNILLLSLTTLIDLLYGIFLYKAYSQGKLSVIETVMIGELPFTIALGLIFFGEKLNILQICVILLIIIGIFLISKNRASRLDKIKKFFTGKSFLWEKGVLLAMAAFIFSAIYNFLTVINARNISAFTAIWFPWMLSSCLLFVYIINNQGLKSLWRNSYNNKRLILLTGIIETAAWVFYALASVQEGISIVTTIVAGYAVVAMALGVKFNKEQIGAWQYFGATLVFVGVIIMSFVSN